ncbi:IclR family transcriptional regulator [Tsukamurella spumae]|uniref:IclR family transcriptional regulator n=1 Tax=Tsukamurella spumae TaxID=44753 RepID=A0A846WYW1_9ACTN|nr:IclR family transcriptional regulator [Tsukamurella spumae]NKY18378.1 IclR family transcriptional regulator [Tsukamurella spumae]
MCPAERNDGATVDRIASVLSAYRPGDGGLGVSELARRTGLPKSTVHRLTGYLVAAGLLARSGTDLRLGLRLFEIGQLATGQQDLVDAARPLLADLRSGTRNTVHLARLEGTEVVYFEVLPGPDAPNLPSRVGGRMPAHATGVGKAILAFSDAEVVDSVIATGLPRLRPRTITSPTILRRQLQRIRNDGVAYEREESSAGTVCVACPVLDAGGAPVAAVSVAGWSNRMRPERVAPAVRAAALTLSRVAARRPD